MIARENAAAGARLLAAALLLFIANGIAKAAVLEGKVVSVADGDTVTVLSATKIQTRVRLIGIDAPEHRQAFGTRSRQALAALVHQQHVSIEYDKKDRYGRVLGKILVKGVDANLEQIKAGMAWHYKAYKRDQSPSDRIRYAQAERDAQSARRGLWSDRHAVAPWDFRRNPRSDVVGIGHPSALPGVPGSAARPGNGTFDSSGASDTRR